MGAAENADGFEAPPQPPARNKRSSSNPFDNAYAPVSRVDENHLNGQFSAAPNGVVGRQSSNGNPFANAFAIYDEGLEDDGADTGNWESEPAGTRAEARFWQPRFYSAYFDINASDFGARLLRSILPFKPLLGWAQYDEESEGGTSHPDLYGPVWVTTTLVLALSMGSSIAHFLSNVFRKKETAELTSSLSAAQFTKLWRAGALLYGYVFVFPVVLTLFQCFFARRALRESSVSTHPVLGTMMVYGYAMTPVIIATAVATVPIKLVQIIAIGVSFCIGALTIMLNLWRDVSVRNRSLAYFVRLAAGLAHAGVGAALIFIFYVRV